MYALGNLLSCCTIAHSIDETWQADLDQGTYWAQRVKAVKRREVTWWKSNWIIVTLSLLQQIHCNATGCTGEDVLQPLPRPFLKLGIDGISPGPR